MQRLFHTNFSFFLVFSISLSFLQTALLNAAENKVSGWDFGGQSETLAKPTKMEPKEDTERAPAGTSAVTASGKDASAELLIQSDDRCVRAEFDQVPGEMISCTEPLSVRYTVRSCRDNKLAEIGDSTAQVTCESQKRLVIKFRTKEKTYTARLRVQRVTDGRAGTVTKYKVESSSEEVTSAKILLPEPTLKNLEGEKSEEAPLKFKFSGFASIEQERTSHYGYSGTSGLPDFTKDSRQPTQNSTSLLSNLNFELAKDRTSLVSVLHLGEIYYGDVATSGAPGLPGPGATNFIQLRNFYLNHDFTENYTVRAGKMTAIADPRSFIFNDHIASVQAAFKSDISEGLLWYGNANQNRPGAVLARAFYLGGSFKYTWAPSLKSTVYTLYRNQSGVAYAMPGAVADTFDDVSGDLRSYWAGATLDWEAGPLVTQVTGIFNQNVLSTPGRNDKLNAYLADAKVTYNWEAPQVNFSLEGLMTSGAEGASVATTSGVVAERADKSKAFNSPVATSYLLTVATSDGLDDAPGTPKDATSTIGNLNQSEGLMMGVFTTTINLSKRATTFARYGHIRSARKGTSGSHLIGNELDAGLVYQLNPSTTVQIDYGRFLPGAFYTSNATADLAAAKLKFSF